MWNISWNIKMILGFERRLSPPTAMPKIWKNFQILTVWKLLALQSAGNIGDYLLTIVVAFYMLIIAYRKLPALAYISWCRQITTGDIWIYFLTIVLTFCMLIITYWECPCTCLHFWVHATPDDRDKWFFTIVLTYYVLILAYWRLPALACTSECRRCRKNFVDTYFELLCAVNSLLKVARIFPTSECRQV